MHPVEREDTPSRSQTTDAIRGGCRFLDSCPKLAVQRGRWLAWVRGAEEINSLRFLSSVFRWSRGPHPAVQCFQPLATIFGETTLPSASSGVTFADAPPTTVLARPAESFQWWVRPSAERTAAQAHKRKPRRRRWSRSPGYDSVISHHAPAMSSNACSRPSPKPWPWVPLGT
jgi:hypothetical protein